MKQVIILNDHKVFKLTNGKGHLGLPIPGASVGSPSGNEKFCRTVGVKWNLLKDKHEPDDRVTLAARYTIKRLKKDTYEVECLDEFMPSLMIFLLYRCGTVDMKMPSKKTRKKHRRHVKVQKDCYLKYGLR